MAKWQKIKAQKQRDKLTNDERIAEDRRNARKSRQAAKRASVERASVEDSRTLEILECFEDGCRRKARKARCTGGMEWRGKASRRNPSRTPNRSRLDATTTHSTPRLSVTCPGVRQRLLNLRSK